MRKVILESLPAFIFAGLIIFGAIVLWQNAGKRQVERAQWPTVQATILELEIDKFYSDFL